MSNAIISHPDCLAHNVSDEHPERPARLNAINDRLLSSGMAQVFVHYEANVVSKKQLLAVHDSAYIDSIYARAPNESGQIVQLDGDTAMMNATLAAAKRAAGAGIMAVDMVMTGQHKKSFCAVRPPGHHAEKDKAMGFCYFNNIAIAVTHALNHYDLKRVAVIDFDVHHGNGTEQLLGGDNRVMFCSSFESPLYPFSGENSPYNNVHNIALQAGIKGPAYQDLVSEHWLPQLDAFAPQLIFISAGFDAHREDDISHINLVERDYRWLSVELVKLANKHADGRIVSMLEGGYSLGALGRSVHAHLDGLI